METETNTEPRQLLDNRLLDTDKTFDSFGFDDRLLKAIYQLNWKTPSLVQSAAIPLALQGKDILAKAKTGSGKTAAYSLPILQSILTQRERELKKESSIKATVLVPTRELVQQVHDHFSGLVQFCRGISVYSISSDTPAQQQRARLGEKPDIIISTPAKLVEQIKLKNITLGSVGFVVIDEADHTLAFGHEQDIQEISKFFPNNYQAFLMSATLNKDLEGLRKLLLHNPAVLQLEDPKMNTGKLKEYYYKCKELDKFIVVYVLLKLKVIPGKAIIFVNDIDRCYKLKLFLERFGISSAVLNSELPFNSRYNIIQQFNKRIFDYLIATDETFADEESDEDDDDEEEKTTKKNKKSEKKEYGVSRGVDFKGVQTVVNFDFPTNPRNYVHRVGRTARGGANGSALSLVTIGDDEERFLLEETTELRKADGADILPYSVNSKVIDAFRYRSEDVIRGIKQAAIRNARVKEIELEMLNSEKLKSHFAENPKEQEMLRHAVVLEKAEARKMEHLQTLPDYLFSATPFSSEEGKRKFEETEERDFDYLGRSSKKSKLSDREKKKKNYKRKNKGRPKTHV